VVVGNLTKEEKLVLAIDLGFEKKAWQHWTCVDRSHLFSALLAVMLWQSQARSERIFCGVGNGICCFSSTVACARGVGKAAFLYVYGWFVMWMVINR